MSARGGYAESFGLSVSNYCPDNYKQDGEFCDQPQTSSVILQSETIREAEVWKVKKTFSCL